MNEGLVLTIRSGDCHTPKQGLLLYTLVESHGLRQQHQQLQLKDDDWNKFVSLENGSSKENGKEIDAQLHDQQQRGNAYGKQHEKRRESIFLVKLH